MTATAAPSFQGPAKSFVERQGPWLLSALLHLAVFGAMAAFHVQRSELKDVPKTLVVQFNQPAAPAPTPFPELPAPKTETPPSPPPATEAVKPAAVIVPVQPTPVPIIPLAAATSADAAAPVERTAGEPEGKIDELTPERMAVPPLPLAPKQAVEILEPVKPEAVPAIEEPAPLPQAASPETALAIKSENPAEIKASAALKASAEPKIEKTDFNAKPGGYTEEEKAVIRQLHRNAELMRQRNRRQGEKGSSEIAQKLNALEAENIAKRSLFSSEGVDSGAVREIALGDAPGDVAKQIMDRYGIVIQKARLGGNQAPAGFLSHASTPQGDFVRAGGGGGGEAMIFSFGPAAMSKMSQLESEALKKGGFNPGEARVVSVTFGPVKKDDRWDLGVVAIKIEATPH